MRLRIAKKILSSGPERDYTQDQIERAFRRYGRCKEGKESEKGFQEFIKVVRCMSVDQRAMLAYGLGDASLAFEVLTRDVRKGLKGLNEQSFE